jgi:selenocysteine lyase/cysteine desulfurase
MSVTVHAAETLGNQRDAFELPDDVAYFNTAAAAPQPRVVREAGERALASRASPWAVTQDDWFTDVERLRGLFARIVGASPDCIAIAAASSYGIAVAARNLPLGPGRRVLVLAEEFPSGIYTWRAACRRTGATLVTVAREAGQTWADAVLAELDERVGVVSVPNVHWTDGALVDLDRIAPAAREAGAALVVDASQSVGAMPVDVSRIRPDFLVTVGYKWQLGPYGLAYLYVAEQHHGGEPLEENWISRVGSRDLSRLVDYSDAYEPGARRFDVGARTSFVLTPMAVAALGLLLDWGVERIAASLAAITDRLARGASALGLELLPSSARGPHLLGVPLPAEALARVAPALEAARCYPAVRGSSLRLSPHLFVTDDDVDRLLGALAGALGTS